MFISPAPLGLAKKATEAVQFLVSQANRKSDYIYYQRSVCSQCPKTGANIFFFANRKAKHKTIATRNIENQIYLHYGFNEWPKMTSSREALNFCSYWLGV